MRVAYVCADPGVPVFGQKGCSIHVQEVIRALQRQGAEVEIFASRIGGQPPEDLAQVPVYSLPKIPKLEPAVREQVALSINPDLRCDLELSGSFDLIYERYSLWSYSAMEYAQAAGIPGLLEVNAPLIEEQSKHRELIDRTSAEAVAKRVFQAATALVAVSAEVKTYLTNYVPSERVHVIPNGVNPDRFPSIPLKLPSPIDRFTVGFVGTLKPWHGLPVLIDAFARLDERIPDAQLLIVGDGPERDALSAELAKRGLQTKVTFTGAVNPSEVPAWLRKMDAAVAPYPEEVDFYFSPLKVYEYMATGLPVVASQVGQLTNLIRNGVNGILCPPGDAIALTRALENLWKSPALCTRLGQKARQTVLQHHTWERVAQQILQIAGLESVQSVTEARR